MIEERRKIGKQIVGLDSTMVDRMMPYKQEIRPITKRHTACFARPYLENNITRTEEVRTPFDETIVGTRTETGIANIMFPDEAAVVEACR